MSIAFERPTPTRPPEYASLEEQPLSLQEKLEGLVYEQVAVMDLLSRGFKRSETAADRQAQMAEVADLAKQTVEYLDVGTIHGAVFTLLEAGLLVPDEDEINHAKSKVALLSDRHTRYAAALMGGATFEQAAQQLGLSQNTLKTYTYAEINKTLGSHSLPQTTRLMYAAGLRPGQVSKVPENNVETAVSLPNATDFVAWMYPMEDLNGLGDLTEQEGKALVQLLTDEIDGLVKDSPNSAKAMRAGAQTVRDWLAGQSLFQIAKSRGKTEGSIRLSLTGFAAKIGSRIPSADIYAQTIRLSGQNAMKELEREIFTPEEAEDRLAPGENTVLDVVAALRRSLPGRKLPFSGEYQENEPKVNEAELVTLLNVYRVPMRVQKIVRLTSESEDDRSDLYQLISDTLDGLAKDGQIVDLGDGLYQSKEWVEYDPAEETGLLEVPDAPAQTAVEDASYPVSAEPSSRPKKDYSEDLDRYHRQVYGSGKAARLTEMLREAGIPADSGYRPGKKKRR